MAKSVKKSIKKEIKEYEIFVDYEYGCCDTFCVMAKSPAEAKRKAIKKYMQEYFKKSYLKAVKQA